LKGGLLGNVLPKRVPKLPRDSKRELEGLVEELFESNILFDYSVEKLFSVTVSRGIDNFASCISNF
jgi:hypothetical protein